MNHHDPELPRRADGPDGHEIEIGDEKLVFRRTRLPDPVPTGRQILKAAGVRPVEDYAVLAFGPDGTLHPVGLDDTFDLRAHGVERVLVFRTDRLFRFLVDGQEQTWGFTAITGRVLKRLAQVDPDTRDVFLEVAGGDDERIDDAGLFRLDRPGVERFVTAPRRGGHGKVRVTVVVNGQPTEVEAASHDPLSSVRDRALEQTQNVGQPAENWELKTEDGTVLDLAAEVRSLGEGEAFTLYLSLKAGVAGA